MFLLQNLKAYESGYNWSFNLNTFKKDIVKLRNFPDNINSKFLKKVLCIYGGRSNYINDENMKAFRNYFPYVEFFEIKHSGHWLHVDNPEKFLDIIFKNLN